VVRRVRLLVVVEIREAALLAPGLGTHPQKCRGSFSMQSTTNWSIPLVFGSATATFAGLGERGVGERSETPVARPPLYARAREELPTRKSPHGQLFVRGVDSWSARRMLGDGC